MEPINGYDYLNMLFVHSCVLLLVVLLVLYIFSVGGVDYVYIWDLVVELVRGCVLCVFAINCGSLTPNEDIVRFRRRVSDHHRKCTRVAE